MRCLPAFVLLPFLIQPALAAGSPQTESAHHHARKTWEQRFTNANRAHDGHLTLAEAKAGDKSVAKHFDEIDADHKGYVTEDDIRAWRGKHRHHRTHRSGDTASPGDAAQLAPDQHRTAAASPTPAAGAPAARPDAATKE